MSLLAVLIGGIAAILGVSQLLRRSRLRTASVFERRWPLTLMWGLGLFVFALGATQVKSPGWLRIVLTGIAAAAIFASVAIALVVDRRAKTGGTGQAAPPN